MTRRSNRKRREVARKQDRCEPIDPDHLFDGLSVRARNVLTALGVEDCDSLLHLTHDQLAGAWSCGKKTSAEIEAFQATLRGPHASSTPDNQRPTPSFDNTPSEVLDAIRAVLSVRANHVLEDMQVTTLKAFMLLEDGPMLKCRNCGRKTVREIQSIQSHLQTYAASLADNSGLFDPSELVSAPCLLGSSVPQHSSSDTDDFLADTAQPAVWLRRWVHSLARSKRQERAFLLRKGMLGFAPMTLDLVGEQVGGVTRERARQMDKAVEERAMAPHQQQRLRPLIEKAAHLVQHYGGMLEIKTLTRELLCKGEQSEQMRFAYGLVEFMATLSEWEGAGLQLNQDGVVSHKDCGENTRRLADILEHTALDKANERHSDRLWSISRAALKSALLAKSHSYGAPQTPQALSDPALNAVLKAAKCSMKTEEDRVYSADLWKLRFGNIVQMTETVLQQMGRPAHFSEVASEIRKWRSGFTDNNTHATLDRAKHLLLWDLGTFVHHDNIVVPLSLIHDVEEWLLEMLDDEVPFVSVNGAFLRFHSRCTRAGFPSDVALYSCLRRSAHPDLVYPRLPCVYRREGFTERLPMLLALETFLRDAGGPVSQDEFRDFAVNRLFLKDYQFGQLSQRITNVIRTAGWGYIHLDNFELDESFLQTIVQHTEQLLVQEGHCSVDKVYCDKRVTCLAASIDGSVMLYSILQAFAPDAFSLTRYPRIACRSEKEESGRQTIRMRVLDFVRVAHAPCTYETLEEQLVKRLGYKEQQIYSVVREPDVCLYHPGCVVHMDALGWNQVKQGELECQAAKAFNAARKAGRHFARISHLLEMASLPALPSGLHWSRPLIADLLTKGERFLVLGNSREVYLPRENDLELHTLQDLVALLLDAEWGGAANRSAFEDALVQSGIIKKRLTPTMLSPGNKVVIQNGEIALKELLVNA
ncbi:MAG: hypothetical protein JKP90_17645 [Desulfofustis sp. PB-SRB1]|jgi:hypothetical protein|nr:hypothetical protein [Desulfofustis sp. PB-SRB1]